jgi:hypothetical protein
LSLPARGSMLEAALTSLVLTAAAICWINALHDEGVAGEVGIAIVIALVGAGDRPASRTCTTNVTPGAAQVSKRR